MRTTLATTFLIAACIGLSACGSAISLAEPAPVRGHVNNMGAFQTFVATRPTPSEFRRVYPDVTLVLPRDMATMEMRNNNSRFFAQVDQDGKIVGGSFR